MNFYNLETKFLSKRSPNNNSIRKANDSSKNTISSPASKLKKVKSLNKENFKKIKKIKSHFKFP